MTRVWFSSDHHFWHSNIIRFCSRPFSSVEEMNESLIRLWNERVKPEDTVYYLGDFSLALRPVETITPKLNGHKILIPGNHDWVHPAHPRSKTEGKHKRMLEQYVEYGWAEIHLNYELTLSDGTKVHMNHLPPTPAPAYHQSRKHDIYRPEMKEGWMLCGHVHQHWKREGKVINVGVDVWDFAPVSETELLSFIKEGEA